MPFRAWLMHIADRVSCSPDFPVVGAVNSLAVLVGRKVGLRPNRFDDWKVIPNLWGAIVGRPGVFKTPAMQEAMRPLHRPEHDARDRYQEGAAEFQSEALILKARAENAKEEVKKAIKAKKPEHEIAELARLAPGWWLEEYEERAAIMEYDGGLPRAEAERQARLGLVTGQGAAPVLD